MAFKKRPALKASKAGPAKVVVPKVAQPKVVAKKAIVPGASPASNATANKFRGTKKLKGVTV